MRSDRCGPRAALRNVERHAGTGTAEVTVAGGAGWAVIKITDARSGDTTAGWLRHRAQRP
jgi:hypothetical protein